ncbi:unnamed protein product [Nezara viridula]|uniref:Uncharacterized protein n=1 Tax=Nezara viridula TaxID=85310 RepID=A0A9P0E427_NEZVI|nr:unnamed protein product [Nezara viridula]
MSSSRHTGLPLRAHSWPETISLHSCGGGRVYNIIRVYLKIVTKTLGIGNEPLFVKIRKVIKAPPDHCGYDQVSVNSGAETGAPINSGELSRRQKPRVPELHNDSLRAGRLDQLVRN